MLMLQRGHSDFAWFRERTQSLQSDSLSAYATMASPPTHGALNPEPADPQERADYHLPPKTYAGAVNHDPPSATPVNGSTSPKSSDNTSSDRSISHSLNPEPADPQERASQHLPPKSYADSVGQTSQPNGHANQPPSVVITKSDLQPDHKAKLVNEGYTSQDGRDSLTSLKVGDQHQKSLRHAQRTASPAKHKSHHKRKEAPEELASGRKAGAGWERSAYDMFFCPLRNPLLITDGPGSGGHR